MEKMKLTLPEIVDWCIYGLTEGNAEGVPPLLLELKKAAQELEDNRICPLCGTGHVKLHRYSGIEIDD